MATITEDYVSFETARLLKERGFNEKLLTFYITDEAKKEGCFQLMAFTDDKIDNNHSNHCYLAPTLQMAMKWLRVVHQIAITINCWFGGERYISWHCTIMCYGDNLKTQQDVELPYVATYEEACEAAIKYCLENLI